MRLTDRASVTTLLAAAVLALAPRPGRAQASTEVRLCLMDYAQLRRTDPDGALDKLRGCAQSHPGSYQVRRTLGKKLEELATERSDDALAAEALGHLKAAAQLEPGKFADLHGLVAELHERLGQPEEAIGAWERAMPYLSAERKQDAQDRLWALHRSAGHDEEALALWKTIGYRFAEDRDAQLAAARLFEASGDLDAALACVKRALDVSPEDGEVTAAYHDLLTRTAATGGTSDKVALLEAWMPRLSEASPDLLEQLLDIAVEALRPAEARTIARQIHDGDPDHGKASLILAEAAAGDGDDDGALRLARAALKAGLDGPSRARAHELLGRIVERRTHDRYTSAPDKTEGAFVRAIMAGYREALGHYRSARELGLDTEAEIGTVRRALAGLGGQMDDLAEAERAAARERCSRLQSEVRYAYDRDKPHRRVAERTVALARAPGGEGAADNQLASGTEVAVQDADWADGGCWLKVKLGDGRAGWAPSSALRTP